MSAVDVAPVVAELRLQGWEVTLKSDATAWKAVPPNKEGRIVLFAANPSSTIPILRDLRHQGFQWPPKPTTNGHPTVDSKVTSTPFPPKPNPESSTESQRSQAGRSEPIESTKTERPPPQGSNEDAEALAFVRLREAKDYERLAASELIRCNNELEGARRKAATAATAYDDALRSLKEAKAAFDRAFDTDAPVRVETHGS